jgi:hypothetical protein
LTYNRVETRVCISDIGVKAVVKVMKTFPKCQPLQERACCALRNLTCNNTTGKNKVVETGGIEVLLAAITNHLNSAGVCENACLAMYNIVHGSKENTELLITLGGGAAVAKVITKWPDIKDVQAQVKKLASIFEAGWTARSSEK